MTHLTDEALILIYYGEPGAPQNAAAHLLDCRDCAARSASICRTLDACSEYGPEQPRPGFEQRIWRNVEAGIIAQPRRRAFRQQWLGLATAAAALVIAAFLAGRFSARTSTQARPAVVMTALSPEARARVLAIAVADHLDRAEILLTNIANGIPPDRDRAADLVNEGPLLRSAVARSGQTGTLELMDDVERLLTEAANEPGHPSSETVRALGERIERGSVIFKIRIIQSNLRTQGQQS